ncbi:MAG TPA: hypothetical protein VKI99_06955 [Candidatus Dormibacteraeota bacterium]|nr:hypothetical protein [Candidatus Dormibacteraeota bacterium]
MPDVVYLALNCVDRNHCVAAISSHVPSTARAPALDMWLAAPRERGTHRAAILHEAPQLGLGGGDVS